MKLKPPKVVVLAFLCAIVIGTLLLSLPVSRSGAREISAVDTIFTATSAVCVTGLIVCDTPTDWSGFGKVVIITLIQIGGLGIMTLSVFFAVLLGRKLTLSENLVIESTLDHNRVYNAKELLKYIVVLTFLIEFIGAACLFIRWNHVQGWSLGEKLAQAVFHSISAFCNAGFSLFSNNLQAYRDDVAINIIMIALIFLGGIGFVVLLDVIKNVFLVIRRERPRLSLQSKLALLMSAILIVCGALLIWAIEDQNVLKGMEIKEKVMASIFQAVTPRTAGFNTLPVGQFNPATLTIIVFLMFVGASPGSTGGGIKTVTFAVVVATAWAMSKNRDKVFVFKRTVPRTVVRRAILIFIVAVIWVFLATFFLILLEEGRLGVQNIAITSLFEIASAFGTVGLSTGITPDLSTISKILLIITMLAGRVGPLTLALAVAIREERVDYTYPEEKIMVG